MYAILWQDVTRFNRECHRRAGQFFIPGLGQLLQGRVLAAIFYFVLSGVIWVVTLGVLGVLGHIIACLDAAVHRPV